MHLSERDLYTGLISIAATGFALVCIEIAVRTNFFSKLAGRKLLHISAICTCAWAIQHFENRLLLAFIFLAFFFILLAVIRKGWMQVNPYPTYGIALFPLAFAFLLFIPAFPKNLVVYAALVLGICDAFAGMSGEYFGRRKIVFLFETKSWAGFIAFFLSAMVVTTIYFNDYSLQGLVLCTALSLFPAVTELFSYRGSDNLTVPVFTAAWAMLVIQCNDTELLFLLLLMILFIAAAAFAVYKKWLSLTGAVAACWMAMLLYASGEGKAFIAPGLFLVAGSLLSKLNRHPNEKEGRNAVQVFANGITGIVFMILYGLNKENIYLVCALVSFCTSMCDSVSSETGMYFKGRTYDILGFKKTEPGISGGISVTGTLAGGAGALVLAFTAGYFYHLGPLLCLWVAVAGFAGMLADSLLGSWLQVKYRNAGGKLSDDAGPGAKKIKGFYWCNNDMVNVLSNTGISLLFYFIFKSLA